MTQCYARLSFLLFNGHICNCRGSELKTTSWQGERGQNRCACIMNTVLDLSSLLILPVRNPLRLTVGKRHSEVFFRQSKGFAEWFCVAWIKLSHVSTALPAICRAWSFVYWKALEEYWPEILAPFGWSPRLSLKKQRLNFWLPDGLGQIASSEFYFSHLEKEDNSICSISVKHFGIIHIT